ncbi:MAG: hypothetical protein ACLFR1_07720, partial [Spirochaetia bacterium]
YVDVLGLDAALVTDSTTLHGLGHTALYVQDSDGNWVAGNFSGTEPGIGHIIAAFTGSEDGTFTTTETGENNLSEAIENMNDEAAPVIAVVFETTN